MIQPPSPPQPLPRGAKRGASLSPTCSAVRSQRGAVLRNGDDGIIHIESPVQRTYTLGNWCDIWGVPLDNGHVGPASGTVIAYLNGQRYTGDVRAIPLDAHNLIQLDVGGDVAPAPFTFPVGD